MAIGGGACHQPHTEQTLQGSLASTSPDGPGTLTLQVGGALGPHVPGVGVGISHPMHPGPVFAECGLCPALLWTQRSEPRLLTLPVGSQQGTESCGRVKSQEGGGMEVVMTARTLGEEGLRHPRSDGEPRRVVGEGHSIPSVLRTQPHPTLALSPLPLVRPQLQGGWGGRM